MRILTTLTHTRYTRWLSSRRTLFIAALVGMALLIASPELKIIRPAKAVFFATRSVNATTGTDIGDCTGGPCKTITYAVGQAAANDTINVAAGTYAEAVTIPAAKSGLLINGPNVNINACTGTRVTEAIVGNATGAFSISANNVTINGFTLQGNTSGAFFGAGVIIGANTSGVQLLNNIVQNNIVGIFMGGDNSTIRGNLIRNNNNPGPASGTGIYTDQFVAGGTLSNVTIDNNCFVGHVGPGAPGADGQALGFSSDDATKPATGITISNNTFTGNGRAFYMLNVTSSSFIRNTVSGSNFVGSADLRIFEGVNGLTIQENSLSGGAADAMRISNIGTGSSNATNISMSCNSITNYAGDGLEISAGAYTGMLTAENNWWGSATGPTIASNPGGTGETIVDPGAQVDYTPFLTSAIDGDPTVPGFQCPGPPPPLTVKIQDPAVCTGPGGVVTVTAQVTNPNPTAQAATLTATLDPGLLALPGTCTATIGTCNVVNASTVTWSSPPPVGGLPAGQTVTITYQAQVAGGTPTGTSLCISSTATIAGSSTTTSACTTVNCPGVGPGIPPPAAIALSDQKPGSVLFYNIYTSNPTDLTRQNTRINITNTDPSRSVAVHLFFVDGASCTPADSYICLTPSQTLSFTAGDVDPGTTGYIVAVASDIVTGCPINFNFLIGDEFVKLSSGHAANLAAESFAALTGTPPVCNAATTTATLSFDGVSYNQVPRVVAVDNFPSTADGNNTLLILNRVGGDLRNGASLIGSLFGVLYDEAEQPQSFTLASNTCQLRGSLNNSFLRTTQRLETVVSAGRTGWLRLWGVADIGLLGSVINFNSSAGVNNFNQGHNLHKLTFTSASLTIPIIPPAC